jgi:putative endonuclease
MKYVYLLRSVSFPERHYVGCTSNLPRRLEEHNSGQSMHTKKFIPWDLQAYFAFTDHGKADAFEKYLKTGSGRAFAKKHF